MCIRDRPKFVIKPNDAGAKVVVTKNGSTDVDADTQAQTTALEMCIRDRLTTSK